MKFGIRLRANKLALLFMSAGVLGFIASFVLTVDKFKILQDPSYKPACSINPILSCGSVMQSDQASLFGFANSMLGIAAFAALAAVGLAIFAGATFKRWFWQLMQLAAVGGLVFSHWLIYQSLYSLGTLCPYCIVVWVVTIPTFLYLTLHNFSNGNLPGISRRNRVLRFAQSHHLDVLFGWYLLIALLVFIRFWYYWKTLI
jgi:uncharacterized membrane protein